MKALENFVAKLKAGRKKVLIGVAACSLLVVLALAIFQGIGGNGKTQASLQQQINTSAKSTTGYIQHTLIEIVNLPQQLNVSGSAITVAGTTLSADNVIKSEDLGDNTISIRKDFGPSKPGTQRVYGFQDVYRGNLDATLTIQLISSAFQDTNSGLDMSIFGQDQRGDKNIVVYYKAGNDTDGTYQLLNSTPKTLDNFVTKKELLDAPVAYKVGDVMNYIIVVWSNDNGIPANNQAGDNRYQASGTEEVFSFTVSD